MSDQQEITVEMLAAWRKAGEAVTVLDVREDWELATCALPGAFHIPLGALPQRAGELPRDGRLVVMCHHGGRSRRAMEWLRQNGFPQALNLAGGINAWAERVDPEMPTY